MKQLTQIVIFFDRFSSFGLILLTLATHFFDGTLFANIFENYFYHFGKVFMCLLPRTDIPYIYLLTSVGVGTIILEKSIHRINTPIHSHFKFILFSGIAFPLLFYLGILLQSSQFLIFIISSYSFIPALACLNALNLRSEQETLVGYFSGILLRSHIYAASLYFYAILWFASGSYYRGVLFRLCENPFIFKGITALLLVGTVLWRLDKVTRAPILSAKEQKAFSLKQFILFCLFVQAYIFWFWKIFA